MEGLEYGGDEEDEGLE
ncbi:hypothetical protein A2U01_0056711, partial [Trifolium medium]|nr:hypothetical protein [Trifolium medium]